MKNRLHFLFVAICLALLCQTGQKAFAQAPRTIEVGPHFGASSYIGELNTWTNLGDWKWNEFNQFGYDWGLLARFNYDSRWSFRMDYTHGKIRACDTTAAWRPEAMLNFQSTVNDLSLMVEFNFLDYYTGHIKNVISPYIFGGISGLMFNTKPFTKDDRIDTVSLRPKKTEGVEYAAFSLSIPFGVGCKMSLSKHLAATVEWRMHYTFTDYLDDVSGVYPDDKAHAKVSGYDLTDPSGKFSAKQQRGNSQTNDWYGFINLSLTWKFVIPNRSSCRMNYE